MHTKLAGAEKKTFPGEWRWGLGLMGGWISWESSQLSPARASPELGNKKLKQKQKIDNEKEKLKRKNEKDKLITKQI